MSNINFFRVLQSGGFGGSSGGEIDWDDFTLSKTSPNLSVVAIDLDVNPDQTEIFFAPNSTKRIDVYDFDTTGDVSDGFTFSTTGTTLNKWPQSFQFNPTGTKIFAIMRNKNVTASIHSTALQWEHKFKMEVSLEKGSLILDGILSGSKTYGKERIQILEKIDNHLIDKKKYFFKKDKSWQEEVDEFADIVKNNKDVKIGNLKDALCVMKMINKIYKNDKHWKV